MPALHTLEGWIRRQKQSLTAYMKRSYGSTSSLVIRSSVSTVTLPYYRLYYFNTVAPLRRIAFLASNPRNEDARDMYRLLRALRSWRERKLSELQFVTVASAILAAGVVGAFSWTTIEEAYWLTPAFWHSSLILAIFAILLSASEVTVLHLMGPVRHLDSREDYFELYKPLLLSPRSHSQPQSYIPRLKMIFTWQAPLMFMSYSVCTFLAGLTILVCTPFIKYGAAWNDGHSIAVFYLTVLVGSLSAFIFCSFWVYHYVDLKIDLDDQDVYGSPQQQDIERTIWSAQFGPLDAPLEIRQGKLPCRQDSISRANSPETIR